MVNRVASGTQHRGDSFEAIRRLSSHTNRFITTFAASSAGLISFAQPIAPPTPPHCMFSPSNLIAPMFVQATASSSSSSSPTLRAATLSGIQGARHPLSSCTSSHPSCHFPGRMSCQVLTGAPAQCSRSRPRSREQVWGAPVRRSINRRRFLL
jgi:hypothetical protein